MASSHWPRSSASLRLTFFQFGDLEADESYIEDESFVNHVHDVLSCSMLEALVVQVETSWIAWWLRYLSFTVLFKLDPPGLFSFGCLKQMSWSFSFESI